MMGDRLRRLAREIGRSLLLVLLSSSTFEELFFFLPSVIPATDDGDTLLGEEGLDPCLASSLAAAVPPTGDKLGVELLAAWAPSA